MNPENINNSENLFAESFEENFAKSLSLQQEKAGIDNSVVDESNNPMADNFVKSLSLQQEKQGGDDNDDED